MTATLENLKAELEPYKNTLVIDEWYRVVKLVDVIDGHDDYYWVLVDRVNGLYHATCVGGWIPLKGIIDNDKYNRMVKTWNYNSHTEHHAQ